MARSKLATRALRACCLTACLVQPTAWAASRCATLDADARRLGTRIAGCEAGRVVAGKGRLVLHTAPAVHCQTEKLFVIPGDKLIAYTEYAGYTAVLYLHPKTGREADGWVASSRLSPTGTGIAPCP